MGKSATGKDTIFRNLLQDESLAMQEIVPYTTRPIRSGEIPGKDYYYVTEEEFQILLSDHKIVEHRSYDTIHGIWRYFMVEDANIKLTENDYLVVGTLEAYPIVRAYFGETVVVPIMITVEDGIRLQRALNRERQQENPKYEELCRRFLADSIDYAAENMVSAGIEMTFENNTMETCLIHIKEYIKGFYGNI